MNTSSLETSITLHLNSRWVVSSSNGYQRRESLPRPTPLVRSLTGSSGVDPNTRSKAVTISMLNGIHYLHAHDIVHRDLKYVNIDAYETIYVLTSPPTRPENILYRSKETGSDIVIADFGMWACLTVWQ